MDINIEDFMDIEKVSIADLYAARENAENKAWLCAGKGDFKTAWSYTKLVFKLDSLLIKKENAVHKKQDLELKGKNK